MRSMMTMRQTLEYQWKDAIDYTFPLRAQGFSNNSSSAEAKAQSGFHQKASIFDSTGPDSSRILASSTLSGLIPDGSNWFRMSIPSLDPEQIAMSFEIRSWLDDTAQVIQKKINSSYFDSMAFETMLDTVIVGFAGLFISIKDGELVFEHISPDNMYIADTMNKGRIDTVYRKMSMTIPAMVAEFGMNKIPETLKAMLRQDPYDTKPQCVIHCVRPRMMNGKQAQGKQKRNMPWQSVWVHEGTGMVLKEGGYNEFPYAIPRWSRIPGTHYATGAVNDVLPDIKTVNKVAEFILVHSETVIAPPIVVKDDGVVNPQTVQFAPRRVIVVEDTENLQALRLGGDFNVGEAQIIRLQQQIRRGLMTDSLNPDQQGTPATATEIRARTRRVRQILGPVFGRMQREFLAPIVERVYNLCVRSGEIPPAPEAIANLEILPIFNNPLSRAARQDDIDAMDQLEGYLGSVAQIDPTILDKYDGEKALDIRADILGVPNEVLRAAIDVEQIRRQREEQQQQLQQQLLAQQGAQGETQ